MTSATDDFEGTLESKSGCHDIKPDCVDIYESRGGFNLKNLSVFNGEVTKNYDSIIFKENLKPKTNMKFF